MTGEITPRLTWQGSATNTYGTDAARQVAPIDYRMIGKADAPAPDTAAYGLHAGLMTEGEEGVKLRYEVSRRSAWDFSGSHNYTKYNADGFLVHSARARVEYLHRIAQGTALGFYGSGEHQTNPLDCTLGGAGMRVLSSWGSRASLNLSGGLNGANPSCGKRVQFTGNAALYTRLTNRTDFYLTGRPRSWQWGARTYDSSKHRRRGLAPCVRPRCGFLGKPERVIRHRSPFQTDIPRLLCRWQPSLPLVAGLF